MLPSTLRDELRWRAIGITRSLAGGRVARSEWEALSAWRGVVHQAYQATPLQANLSCDLWHQGQFQDPKARRAFFTTNRREREPSSHHYGHDLQLKRFIDLPLIGAPLPVLLEHGLKVARSSRFESPKPWAKKGFLCMGPLRARWLENDLQVPARAIGPWIRFAKPLLSAMQIARQKKQWGKTLLVVLAHSWDQVKRSMDLSHCIEAVEAVAKKEDYQHVVWLRHWKDPEDLPLRDGWIKACNGHRSNPWFLDSMRTLLELSDGLASNAFGTHLGYAEALGIRLHWIDVDVEQQLDALSADKAEEEQAEWEERKRLSLMLRSCLTLPEPKQSQAIHELFDPYWGLSLNPIPADLSHYLER